MASRFGHDVLAVFDVSEESHDFLADMVEQRTASEHDFQQLFDQSLVSGDEDFRYMIECATSSLQLQDRKRLLTGNDVLTSMWCMLNSVDLLHSGVAWRDTDALIERARSQAQETKSSLESSDSSCFQTFPTREKKPQAKSKPCVTSHYWASEVDGAEESEMWKHAVAQAEKNCGKISTSVWSQSNPSTLKRADIHSSTCKAACALETKGTKQPLLSPPIEDVASSRVSPYFADTSWKDPKRKKPPAGTISCIPFPPLTSDSFGIIQEKVAHEPFWLLIAITFLIKTSGQLAIPVFLQIKQHFPTPVEVADAANAAEILGMIQHLGLGHNRLRFMQKYARAFLKDPPKASVLYRVRNYASRDAEISEGQLETPTADMETDGWEIGHMTQGKYAMDSWRIFCRDALLGRAEDWNGKGCEPEFQPEWMRVLPADKELRAYLRWMWMREGWEWDPTTGERTALRPEMQRAVNEGRVEYDDSGGLCIIDAM